VKVSFLPRDRERTVPMYIPKIYQNDRDEKLNQIKIHAHGHAPRTKLSLYIDNDLPKRITRLKKLYADDTKILSVINSEKCRSKIQADLDNSYKNGHKSGF
jgi:hypothetical protein